MSHHTGAHAPIGVFDSGVGGLTVLRALVDALPHEDFIYFGDTARTPYGTKSLELVQGFSLEIADYLLSRKVKAVVVACNSASAAAASVLRTRLPVPVLDVINPTTDQFKAQPSSHLGVLATRATVQSGLYQSALEGMGHTVWAQACPLLAPMIEEGLWDDPIAQKVVEHYLEGCPQTVRTLILGCTHYPMLRPLLGRLAPHMQLVDSATSTAQALCALLDSHNLHADRAQGAVSHVVTGDVKSYQLMASRFLFPAARVDGLNVATLSAASGGKPQAVA